MPSEKAFAYKMKYEAMRRTVKKKKLHPEDEYSNSLIGKRTVEILSEEGFDSPKQIQRYLKIADMIPEMLEKLDYGLISFHPAFEIAFLKPNEQRMLLDAMDYAQSAPSVSQAQRIKNEESAMDIEIYKICSFQGHPFKVVDDDKMLELVESIKANGVLSPVLIRPCGNDLYEMISGHRRLHAAKLAGLTAIPSIIREMTDDEATIAMVDANIQREELLPSEKAWAFKMKMEAMKNQGSRSDLSSDPTSTQIGWKSETAVLIGEQVGESKNQVRRYIRLTELIPELLDLVDAKRLNFTVAVDVSYIDKEIQGWLNECLTRGC